MCSLKTSNYRLPSILSNTNLPQVVSDSCKIHYVEAGNIQKHIRLRQHVAEKAHLKIMVLTNRGQESDVVVGVHRMDELNKPRKVFLPQATHPFGLIKNQ